MAERFDAVVVGAGPAGSAAALALAKEKFSVLLVERGRTAGSKNMFDGGPKLRARMRASSC